jgi:L-ascorbate metabolism protein UlaG (beta-lactamase superfamily)
MNLLKFMVFILIIPIWVTSVIGCSSDEEIILNENTNSGDQIKEREAKIWYLGHSGFAVQTTNYFLIFDNVEEHLKDSCPIPEHPCLSNGFIDPEEIKDLKVRVFASHQHGDHFEPVIFEWESHIPDIEYFFGWQASNNADYHYLIGPRAVWQDDDIEIYTINSNHAGVLEVAYMVKVDSLVIYHNGDYQGNYQEDMNYLKTKTECLDIAFLFCVWQEQWKYHYVNRELITQLQPKAAFPMHVRIGDEATYFEPFRSTYEPMMETGRIILTNNIKGISFYYKNGQIKQN